MVGKCVIASKGIIPAMSLASLLVSIGATGTSPAPPSTPQYREVTDGTDTYRKGVRDAAWVVDKTLTGTGFSGTEDIDWVNLIEIMKPSELISSVANTVDDPFDVFTASGNTITRGAINTNKYAQSYTNYFAAVAGQQLKISIDFVNNAVNIPFFTLTNLLGSTSENYTPAEGANEFYYTVLTSENLRISINRNVIVDFSATISIQVV